MMTHKRQGHEHLTGKTAYESRRKTNETIGLDKFVEIDAQKLSRNAKMISEIEMLNHLENMVFAIRVLEKTFKSNKGLDIRDQLTHFLRLSRILISTNA